MGGWDEEAEEESSLMIWIIIGVTLLILGIAYFFFFGVPGGRDDPILGTGILGKPRHGSGTIEPKSCSSKKKLLVGGGVLLAGGSIAYATGMFDGKKEEEEPSNAVPGEPWMWGVGLATIGGGFAFWKWGWPRLRGWYWPPPTGPGEEGSGNRGADGQTDGDGNTPPGEG